MADAIVACRVAPTTVGDMSFFTNETAISAAGDGSWSTWISDAWNIGTNPNGGYLLAPVLRAMRELSDHPDPLTVTTHFLRPGAGEEPGEINAELIRSGRTLSNVRGALTQGGKTRITSVAAFADLDDPAAQDDPTRPSFTMDPPDLPPVEDCLPRSGVEQGVDLPIRNRVDLRIHPDQAKAGQAKEALISGWIRFTDDHPVDTLSLPLLADAFPPSLFGALGYIGWVPTIELTVHVRRRPVPGWIRGSFHTSDLAGNKMIEDGALWDESGALVAQSRQVGLLLTAE